MLTLLSEVSNLYTEETEISWDDWEKIRKIVAKLDTDASGYIFNPAKRYHNNLSSEENETLYNYLPYVDYGYSTITKLSARYVEEVARLC